MRLIKLIVILNFLLLLTLRTNAQDISEIKSLGDFFVGIPIFKGFDTCKEYIARNPFLGIDSIKKRGIYSSLKPGQKDHFPFPDSVKVKVLLSDKRSNTWRLNLPDSAKGICIEAIFENNKAGKKASSVLFKQFYTILKSYYSKKWGDDMSVFFHKSGSKNFPDCLLIREFNDDLHGFYIILEYWEL